ncbi:hypothetical protein ABZ726_20255 [Streptomyces hundungensis]|uniref:hypothetical protein n=1 Tax=Streptomyces hundungensis TaxID=1077946 RepID=UPI0033CCE353
MTSIRLMDSDPDKAKRTAAAVRRALEASPEVVVSNVSVVPNRRGPGSRVYMEVLLLEANASSPIGDAEARVERTDPSQRGSRRSALPLGKRALPGR